MTVRAWPATPTGPAALREEHHTRASLVLRMARVASCTHSLSIMLKATLNELQRPGLRAGVIVLQDEPAGLYLAAAERHSDNTALIGALTPDLGAVGLVAANGRSLIITDLACPGLPGPGYELPLDSDPRSVALVPVRASRRVVGLLAVDSYLPDAFDERDLENLEDIALAISGALQAVRLKAVQDRLDNTQRVIYSLARAVEAKDRFTEAHTERVATTARMLGESAGLGGKDLDDLYSGGMIHDIGKIGVPDSILLKPGPLSRSEFNLVKRHPGIGAEIVQPLRSAASLLSIVRHHHERMDGSGYPEGLRGAEIPLVARMVAICDAFDAMISNRPYRAGLTRERAIEVLETDAGSQWDPELVRLFVDEIAHRPTQNTDQVGLTVSAGS